MWPASIDLPYCADVVGECPSFPQFAAGSLLDLVDPPAEFASVAGAQRFTLRVNESREWRQLFEELEQEFVVQGERRP